MTTQDRKPRPRSPRDTRTEEEIANTRSSGLSVITAARAEGFSAGLLEAALAGQMEHDYFPIRLTDLAARMSFREVTGEPIAIADAVVRQRAVNHTTACLGYRIEADNAAVVYLTDTEPYASYEHGAHLSFLVPASDGGLPLETGSLSHAEDRRLADFAAGADLLIMDAQYSP